MSWRDDYNTMMGFIAGDVKSYEAFPALRRLERTIEQQEAKSRDRDKAVRDLAERARTWEALGAERFLVASAIFELLGGTR